MLKTIAQGALAGFLSALVVDILSFKKWHTWSDVESFDWRVATFRWFQGVVTGALTGAGIVGLS